jgi:hypothetical protein
VRRLVGLGAQGIALLDAEAVLLVDDDETEVGEVDALVEQGVGADDDARGTAADVFQNLAPRGPPPAKGQDVYLIKIIRTPLKI